MSPSIFPRIIALLLAGIVAAASVFILAMTQSSVATPVLNWLTGERVQIEKAWLRFPNVFVLETRDMSLGDQAQVRTGSFSYNLFGLFPGLRFVSSMTLEDGRYDTTLSESDRPNSGLNVREWVDHIELIDVTVKVGVRSGLVDVNVLRAEGSVTSGAAQGEFQTSNATISIEGTAKQLRPENWQGRVDLTGDNLATVAELFGIAAPDTPPVQMNMNMAVTEKQIDIEISESEIGDSDIRGELTLEHKESPPVITANLFSDRLDFDDLGIIFGIPVGVGEGETVSRKQQRARDAYEQGGRLIPNAFIDLSRLQAVDGSVAYKAEQVVDSIFDLGGLTLNVDIEGRIVRVTNAVLDFPAGQANAYMTLDATVDPALTDIRGDLSGVSSTSLGLDPHFQGTLNGEFKLSGTGNGFRQFASSVEGQSAVWSSDGELLAVIAEAAGLDLVEGLAVLPGSQDPSDYTYTRARCLVAVMDLSDGQGQFGPTVLDTEDSTIIVDGTVDFSKEEVDIDVRSDAKDLSWGALVGDVSISGSLSDPQISFLSAETVFQVTIGALLAGIAGPLAALPFVEPGGEADAPCGALLSRANEVTQ